MKGFAISYSLGKDGSLAFWRALQDGLSPVCLVTMFRVDAQRSWFHGADEKLLKACAACLDLPALILPASSHDYASVFENGLVRAREMGAEYCVFGDIDLEPNRRWEEERCQGAGLSPLFPLWNQARERVIDDLLSDGFKCVIKTIAADLLPLDERKKRAFCEKYLGKPLTREFAEKLRDMGLDACGENGEYHTLTTDGPIFKKPLSLRFGKILWLDKHATIEIEAEGVMAGGEKREPEV